MLSGFLLVALGLAVISWDATVVAAAFGTTLSSSRIHVPTGAPPSTVPLFKSSSKLQAFNDDQEPSKQEKLVQLGFAEQELKKRQSEQPNVKVNIVDNVDPFTLTAIGFTLIAFNFFVFANVGDGGIGGVVASIINLSKEQ